MRETEPAAVRYWFPKPYADAVQRFRVPAGFVLLAAFAYCSKPVRRSILSGLPITCAGLLLRAWASGHLAKNKSLATSGPYSILRNPLYAGTLLAAAGVVVASRSRVLTVTFLSVFLLVYLPAVELEEQHLRELFPDYETYARRVPRFLPARPGFDGGGRFSWRLYRKNQEWKAALGFVVAAAWLVGRALFL